ncbi:hypothetical protein VTJ49DRAFT_7426 [Mycothermus thermophilus]|uniref:Polyketide synthase n=1 Tax=Humicola insolens TaxID=85995 RepID=A0ABR3VGW3_HUMIN
MAPAPTPIAVIGMSCRFAGDVDSPSKLWDLLAEGRSAWSEIPKDRFNIDGFHHPNHEKLNGTNVIGGHFLNEDIALFDAQFFNLSAEMAAALDPQFRLQLESTYEALESAGLTLQDVAGSNTAVFAGSFFPLHQGCQSLRAGETDMAIVGSANLMFNPDMFMAMSSVTLISKDGKSYAFDNRANGYGRGEGSATVILKRLDDALRDGDPIRAVIRETGVNQDGRTETITTPSGAAQEALIRDCYRRAGLDPAETGYFEAHGTGTPTGDPIEVAAIAAVFKDAKRDGEPLRIGSVKTNIGHTEAASGLAAVMKVALALEMGLIPPSINFEKPNEKLKLEEWNLKVPTTLEAWPDCHGIRRASINNFGYGGSNAHVIMEAFDSYRAGCLSGVIQTNGGKGYPSRNELVKGGSRSLTNGDSGAINGHNGHEYSGNGNGNGHSPRDSTSSDLENKRSRVFTLSGKDERATGVMAEKLRQHLAKIQESETTGTVIEEQVYLDNLSYTLNHRRTVFPWVSVVTANSITSLIQNLDSSSSRGQAKPVNRNSSPPRLGFVYTGQGAQWWAMGRELISVYPAFKSALLDCDAELKKFGATWNIIDELSRSEPTTRVNQLDYSTPLCVALQIALTLLLRAWDITPVAVASHSSGEIAAAFAAGALDLPSAMAVAYARGDLASGSTRSKEICKASSRGGMTAVGLGKDGVQPYLARVTRGKVVLACENSPGSVTLSGDVCALEEVEGVLKADNVFVRRLRVDAAWHSHHMEAVAEAYREAMEGKVRPAVKGGLDVVFASPSTGRRMHDPEEMADPGHWVRSLTGPVRFVEAFRSMCFGDGPERNTKPEVDMVIEVGPHAALSGPIQEILGMPEFDGIEIPYASCLVRKQNAVDTMLNLVSNLVRNGHPVNLGAVNFPFGRHGLKVLTDLPHYPWNHQTRHWAEPRLNRALRARSESSHDLLGSLVLGANKDAPVWRHFVRVNDVPWVRDHVVQNAIVYPAAGYLCMAIEGAARHAADKFSGRLIQGYCLRDVDIINALVVPETSEGVELQLSLRPCGDRMLDMKDWCEFVVQSVDMDSKWTDHCKGLIMVEYQDKSLPHLNDLGQPLNDAAYRIRIRPQDLYASLRAGGISHGPLFQNLHSIRTRSKQSVAVFTVADSASSMPHRHQHPHVVHPTTLDSVFQAAYSALPGVDHSLGSPKVPSSPSPVITISNLTYTSIGPSPPTTTPSWTLEKFTTPTWIPHPSFLPASHFPSLLSTPLPADEATHLLDLRRACHHYITSALSQLTPSDIPNLAPHHRKFYLWMLHQSNLARTGRLAPGSQTWATTPPEEQEQLLSRVWSATANGEMVCRLGEAILPTLRGEVAPLELMLEGGLLTRYYAEGLKWARANRKLGEMVAAWVRAMPFGRRVRVLEVGAGTGGATAEVLAGLEREGHGREAVGLYEFTDVSSGFFEKARERFEGWGDVMRFRKLDVENDVVEQGFEEGGYDVVVACQVLHATRNMERTMRNVRRLLRPGGKLFIMDTTRDQMDVQFVFGFLPGWWLSEEEERKFSPSLTVPMWDRALNRTGFNGVEVEVRDCDDDELYAFSVIASTAAVPNLPRFDVNVSIVVAARSKAVLDPWIDDLRLSLGLLTGTIPTVNPLEQASPDEHTVCVLLDDTENPVLASTDDKRFEALKTVCTRSRGVLWLTRGGVDPCPKPLANLAAGFFRSVRHEYSNKRLGTLDLDPARPAWSPESVKTVTDVFRALFADLTGVSEPSTDYEFAERDGIIHVPRYFRDVERNEAVFGLPSSTEETPKPRRLEPFLQPDRPLRLTVGTPGLLDTLAFADDPTALEPLPEDHVEIEPRAFGVNFRDVMVAMGQLRSDVMGYECAGIVTRVGAAVGSQLSPGDRVTVLLKGHYGNVVRTHWARVAPIPDDMAFETAASLPTQFVTAYHSLHDLARVQAGETVLIHSATGGVGQAAVMLAQRVGAKVLVTVGSDEKRQLVTERYGIPPESIFSSRDTSFAPGVMAATHGKGVDVVLNSLAGPMLQASFDCLAPFGRFIELGKRDAESNNSLAMEAFTRAVTFSSVDVNALGDKKPLETNRILKEVVSLVAQGDVDAVHPVTVYPLSDAERAFRLMQAGKHIGKIVLSVTPETVVPVLPRSNTPRFRPNASYLVVGGFGGIGRSICRWLAEQGAQHLVVLSRSAGDDKAADLREELSDVGPVSIGAIACDISNRDELKRALGEYAQTGNPPIRGVIHGGMELRDSVLEHMSIEDYHAALAPKLHGSWNLHESFSSPDSLDFFIMLSSLSGVLGLASQANYSAGGAFQDALGRYRVAKGLPAVSLDLGLVTSVGYLAETDDEDGSHEGDKRKIIESLKRHGLTPLRESDVLSALASAITTPFAGQLSLGLNTGPELGPDSALRRDRRFSALEYRQPVTTSADDNNQSNSRTQNNNSPTTDPHALATLLSTSTTQDEAAQHVSRAISRKLADIFLLGEASLANITDRSLTELGVDSLVAVELRNMIALRAGADLSIFEIMQSGCVGKLARTVVGKSRFVVSK